MPREARVKDNYGVYHIRQQSSGHRDLFENDRDRNKFLSILSSSKEKNNFKIYGYCLIKGDIYHLIINCNGADISKIMKEINIKFALYADASAPIFKDRYKSELIRSKESLMTLLKEIHENGRKIESNYNSYCFYDENSLGTTFLLDIEDLKSLPEDCRSINGRADNCMTTLAKAKKELNHIASLANMDVDELLKDKLGRNDLIKEFRKNSTLSLKELGVVFGNLSESTICKILNN